MKKTLIKLDMKFSKTLIKQYQKVYLELQRYLFHCLKWTDKNSEKQDIKDKIEEVGITYSETIKRLKSGQ